MRSGHVCDHVVSMRHCLPRRAPRASFLARHMFTLCCRPGPISWPSQAPPGSSPRSSAKVSTPSVARAGGLLSRFGFGRGQGGRGGQGGGGAQPSAPFTAPRSKQKATQATNRRGSLRKRRAVNYAEVAEDEDGQAGGEEEEQDDEAYEVEAEGHSDADSDQEAANGVSRFFPSSPASTAVGTVRQQMTKKTQKRRRAPGAGAQGGSVPQAGTAGAATQRVAKKQKKNTRRAAARKPAEGDQQLRIQAENPKKPGSKSWARYEAYKAARTVGELLRLGGTRADLRHDVKKGYIAMCG